MTATATRTAVPSRVSIVVPVFNEERAVLETVGELTRLRSELPDGTEIIFVDDGSTDASAERLASCDGIILVRHSRNRGYGASLKSGIRRATGDLIVITDADGTYPNARIPELLREMAEHDMVVGARVGKSAKIPLLRRFPKWVLRMLANYLTGERIPDLNSGLRVFNRRLALSYFPLISDGFSFTTTITLAMLSNGQRVRFIPIEYFRRSGTSKIRPIADTLNFLFLIVRAICYFNPLKIFLPTSLVVATSGVAFGLYQLVNSGFHGIGQVPVLLILGSLQIGLLGILADMISKKGSPATDA
jgi:glycosyltransferase involved in cell wall biosynthesis